MTSTLRLPSRPRAAATLAPMVAIGLALVLSGPVLAQTAPAGTHTTGATAEAAPQMVDLYTQADAQAVLDARLVALKTVIGLTPEQEKLWPPVEDAIRKVARQAQERAAARTTAEPAMNFLDVLERVADAEAGRAADLKTVIAAARPLVAALSEEQKRRIPAFLGMTDHPGAPQPTRELWIFEAEQE